MAESRDIHPRLQWQNARIETLETLSPRVRRVVLRPQHWLAVKPGQHLDVRLTAPDGYQAQRSYSLLRADNATMLYELGIEQLDSGEVSPWFHNEAQIGDDVDVLGPVGGHFVLDTENPYATLLIGSGSGVVPLLAMAAHLVHANTASPSAFLVAARSLADVLQRSELEQWETSSPHFKYLLALSRDHQPPRARDHIGRLHEADIAWALEHLGNNAAQSVQVFVCGRNPFVENVLSLLANFHIPATAIRTERFGE